MILDMPDSDYFDGSHYGIHAISDIDKYGPRGFFNRHIENSHSDFGNKSFTIGTAGHELILRGREAYESRVVKVPPSYENDKGEIKPWNGNAKICRQWKTDNADKLILNESDLRLVDDMNDSVFSEPETAKWFEFGHPEVGFRNTISGVPVQCKVDWLATDKDGKIRAIVDLKTAISIEEFKKSFHKFGYWRQAAHYTRVVGMEIGRYVPFIFVVVEKTNPYRTEVFEIDDDYIAEGDEKNKISYNLLSEYLESHGNRKPWPMSSYLKGTQIIEKPAWL